MCYCFLIAMQEGSQDSDLKTLRAAIQYCESKGMVDFELGGHVYSRPPSVVQGHSADKRNPQ